MAAAFVTRLACADMPKVEHEREVYIVSSLRYSRLFHQHPEILEGALAMAGRRTCWRRRR